MSFLGKTLSPAIIALTVLYAFPALSSETQLLSVVGLKLQPIGHGAGQYIAGFDIKTWGVRVLAVCHIPGGWTISAGKNANPEGILSGSAGEGVAFIDAGHVSQLSALFLIEIDDYHAVDRGDCSSSCTPATFSGVLEEGVYGVDGPDVRVRLSLSNISLTPSSICPAPG